MLSEQGKMPTGVTFLDALQQHLDTPESCGMSLRLYLAEAIIAKLNQCGWTTAELAARSGISESYITSILHSDVNCTLDTAGRLLWALGERDVSRAWMKCGSKERMRRRYRRQVDAFVSRLGELAPDIEAHAVYKRGPWGAFLVLRYPDSGPCLTMFMDALLCGDINALAEFAVQELSRA